MDERELLAEIAREDEDPRVRRAAVAKLMDADALAAVARTDADSSVRDAARAMLRDIALDAFEGVADNTSLAAVEALATLADVKALVLVARTTLREDVARRALARVHDEHALGSLARHAALDPIRMAAFDSLQDHGEIVLVAMNGQFKDTAMAAVERLSSRQDLEQIASRSRNKSAVKRARGLLREMDDRAAAEAAAAATLISEAAPVLVERPDGVSEVSPLRDEQEEERAAAERVRTAAEAVHRFEEARAEAEAGRRRLEEAAEEKRRKEAERRQSRLTELLQEAEAASADPDLAAARSRLIIVGREWKDLTSGLPIDAEVAERYRSAAARVAARENETREQEAHTRREVLARLHGLLGRVEPLLVKPDLTLQAGERAIGEVRAALADLPPLMSKAEHDDIARRLKNAQSVLTPRLQELRDLVGWQRWANVGIQEHLCEQMEALRQAEDPEKIATEVHQLQQQWRQAADVPRPQRDALWQRFKTAHDEVWARVAAHLAAESEAREANLAKKVALCERAEALADSTDWVRTAEAVKGLQAEWKIIGPVVRGREKAIWERFRVACDRFFTRRQTDLVERKKTWASNLARKEALCAQVEALADSTDWEATAGAIKALQAEWKSVGPVKKTRSEAIWQRFRTACDHFFTRYARRHDIAREERVAAREAICTELEALAAPADEVRLKPDPTPVADEVRLNQDIATAEAAAEADIATDVASGFSRTPQEVLAAVQSLRGRWQQEIASRGVDRDRALALDRRFAAAFAAVVARWPAAFAGGDLDPAANQKRMETLVRRMEDLAASLGHKSGEAGSDAALSPTTRLAAMLKEALAANTIGGKVDDGARWRAAAEEVRRAQSSWARMGPVPDAARRALTGRFDRACRWISEKGQKK